jgi:hypothetical protein
METLNTKTAAIKFTEMLKTAGSYSIILLSLVSGFYLGTQYHKFDAKPAGKPMIKKTEETSIAINESNHLMLIDKKTGKYEIYSDSIGFSIFRMYAGKIYQSKAQ